MEFSAFSVHEKVEDPGLIEIIPLTCTSPIWGQYPLTSQPEFPQGSPAHCSALAAISDDCDSLCLLIRQEISHLSKRCGTQLTSGLPII